VSEYSNILLKLKNLPIIAGMEGETLTEMADELGLPHRTVERRIQRAGIKPISKEAIYPLGTTEIIRDVKIGRPPKAKPEKSKAPKNPLK
jgi:hypothetical protein